MNMMNMIMEKNFTCLYYKHEAYLDQVYIQQINDIDFEIWWIWLWKKNFTWLYYKHEAYLDRVYIKQINEGLQECMRDYNRKWRTTRLLD